MKTEVRVFSDVNELSLRAAQAAVRTITDAVSATGQCSLVLSGGSTPRTLYGLLASQFRTEIPWDRVHLFWGDERYVPSDAPDSNYRMVRESLLEHVPCPAANVHPMMTRVPTADLAAGDYEATLRKHCPGDWPRFDLVLLGLGDDGHTASLFPGSPALSENTRWVVPAQAPVEPRTRLTLTFPALNRAAVAYFLVSGAKKADALDHVFAEHADPNLYPAAGIRLEDGAVTWWMDRDARFGNGR